MADSEAIERTEEVSRPGRGRSRGRGRSSSAGSSGRQGSRGRGRGRSKSATKEKKLEKSDEQRVKDRTYQKKEKMKAVVLEMDTEKLRDMVLKLTDREPALVFDLCEGVEEPVPPPPPSPTHASQPSWCRCGMCREMPTELERKCCGCLPRNCISIRNELEDLCLNPQVQALGQRYHREMLGRYNQPVDNYQKMMRHSAYRNFVLWRHGRLGAGVRRVIPSCCVWVIRNRYPSATGPYTGFIPGRFV